MKKQIKFHILVIGVLLLSVGVMAVNAKPKKTHAFTENIKLGGVFPIVKRPDAGRDRRDAFLMAVAELNEQTGASRILPAGINFTAIVKDDDNTAAGGTFAASTLIAEGVDVVIGSSGSSVSAAMAAELGPEKIVQLSYASSSPTLSNRKLYPYFMRNTPSDADQGIAVADLVDVFNWTKGATICTSDSYGTGLIEVFTGIFEERGGTITTAQQFDPQATDVSTQVAAIKGSSPEFVVANMIDVDGATLFEEAGNALLTDGLADAVPWIITDGTSTTATFSGSQAVEDAMQNFIGTTPLAFKTPEYYAFNASWFDPKWEDPKYWKGLAGPIYSQATGLAFNSYAPLAYDAVFIVAKALAAAGTAEGDALLEEMYKVTHTGASGEIKFNPLGELAGRFDYVHLSGTVYTSFGEWNGTGYGLDPATFDLPDTTTFVPTKLTFPPFYVAPAGGTTATTTATSETSATSATEASESSEDCAPGFGILALFGAFIAVIIIARRPRK
jgi:branched-chain amino acid transport system substrate-binding protein